MPIRKTEAVVLRIHPFSNTSQMVVWLTQEGFRLPTAVKGAVRPKSAFLGQYDLFQTCELLYYTRTRDGVCIPRECCTLRRRDNLRVNGSSTGRSRSSTPSTARRRPFFSRSLRRACSASQGFAPTSPDRGPRVPPL